MGDYTCQKCGSPMRFNVPRLGAGGGFVHAITGRITCEPLIINPLRDQQLIDATREECAMICKQYVEERDPIETKRIKAAKTIFDRIMSRIGKPLIEKGREHDHAE